MGLPPRPWLPSVYPRCAEQAGLRFSAAGPPSLNRDVSNTHRLTGRALALTLPCPGGHSKASSPALISLRHSQSPDQTAPPSGRPLGTSNRCSHSSSPSSREACKPQVSPTCGNAWPLTYRGLPAGGPPLSSPHDGSGISPLIFTAGLLLGPSPFQLVPSRLSLPQPQSDLPKALFYSYYPSG